MEKYLLSPDASIKDALKQMDKVASKTLFVARDNVLLGSISDGDIRRAILRSISFDTKSSEIMNTSPFSLQEGFDAEQAKKVMLEKRFEAIPVLNKQKRITDILFWNQLLANQKKEYKNLSDVPVVIMAGGKGTRLEPFTSIFPKPLIPFGNKTIIESIMDEYNKFNIGSFYISVNYKARLIKTYLEESIPNYSFQYIEENIPLGTAGSLKLIADKVEKSFFVSNCDIIIKDDYAAIYDYHCNNNYDLTLVASARHYTIPYGVVKFKKGGALSSISEKPEFNFFVNTGMYILKPEVLDLIPANSFFHITNLINELSKNGGKVGVYPVSEKSWVDVGQWEEYNNALKEM